MNDIEYSTYICPNCGKTVWLDVISIEEYKSLYSYCPYCRESSLNEKFVAIDFKESDAPYENLVYISFQKSTSKNYKKAITLAKTLPNYLNDGSMVKCSAKTIDEYYKNIYAFNNLLELIKNWKSSTVLYYDEDISTAKNMFGARTQRIIGKYKPLLYGSDCALGVGITYEGLPYPFVFYGRTYLAFSQDVDNELYFCECERTSLLTFFELYKSELQSSDASRILKLHFHEDVVNAILSNISNPLEHLKFKDNLCFRCNKKIPQKRFCHPMYGGLFTQQNGWYVAQEKIKYGLTFSLENTHLTEQCPEDIEKDYYLLLETIKCKLQTNDPTLLEHYNSIYSTLSNKINIAIDNNVRLQLGYRKSGESWISETSLYYIVKGIFPQEEVIMHHRPKWLEGLELDIYIPNKKLAFEYQGIQHVKPVKHWGGEKQLQKQKEHDSRKKRICEELGIKLICVYYDEPLTTEYILGKIKEDIKI